MIKSIFGKTRIVFFIALLALATCLPVEKSEAQDLITTMTEQLAKLELDLQEIKQGYAIVQKGLNTISAIKKGDFDLHSLFFNSLMNVNPSIKNWGKVADIIAMQVQLLFGCKSSLSQITASGNFSTIDLQYLSSVYTSLATLTSEEIDELTGLVSDGNWQMTDDDRMSRIDQLFNSVSEKYNFLRSFSSCVMAESNLRTHRNTDLQNLKKLIQP
jgi:hypothetical protein